MSLEKQKSRQCTSKTSSRKPVYSLAVRFLVCRAPCWRGSRNVSRNCIGHWVAEQPFGVKSFPSDNSKLAEMEFYLVADLECDLTIFHPYRTLIALCKKEGADESATEAGEVGAEVEDGPQYWGTGEGQLELSDDALQLAWYAIPILSSSLSAFFGGYPHTALKPTLRSIINDTYRSDLCLLYPPHLLAITALYLTLVLHAPTRDHLQQKSPPNLPNDPHASPLRRSSRQASNSSTESKKPQDIIGFFAGLNVSMSLVSTIAQEMISLYSAWERYQEDVDANDTTPRGALQVPQTHAGSPYSMKTTTATKGCLKRTLSGSRSGSHSRVGTPAEGTAELGKMDGTGVVTPLMLVQLLTRMRENRLSDLARSTHGRPVVVDKRLERTQAAG